MGQTINPLWEAILGRPLILCARLFGADHYTFVGGYLRQTIRPCGRLYGADHYTFVGGYMGQTIRPLWAAIRNRPLDIYAVFPTQIKTFRNVK